MRNIRVEKQMKAPRKAVWDVLADFPNIADWNSGVKKSFATGDQTEGVGASRHCDLAPMGGLEERVSGWDPEDQLVISIDSTSKLPIKRGEVTIDLTDAGEGTKVALSYDYETKYGFLGQMMGGRIDKQMISGFTGFLEELETTASSTKAG